MCVVAPLRDQNGVDARKLGGSGMPVEHPYVLQVE